MSSGVAGHTSTVSGCLGRAWSRRRSNLVGVASGQSCRLLSGRRCMARWVQGNGMSCGQYIIDLDDVLL
jgi:hypothetical protein